MPKYIPPYAAAAELGQSKALRENMHNTTMAVDSILNHSLRQVPPPKTLVQAHLADCAAKLTNAYQMIDFSPKEKATNYFADTICEFSEQLTPEEVYQALLDAMEGHYEYTKKEFDHATQLRDLITGFKNG